MGIFARMARPRALMPNYGPMDDRSYFPGGSFYGGYSPTAAGVAVDSDSAMRLITVQNCVRVLYNCMSQMPCQLMEEVNGIKGKATDHYLYRILGKRPNSWMTRPEFWGMAIAHVSLRGNFYAYKLGNPGGRILELWPLGPDVVQKVTQNPDRSLTYDVRLSTGEVKPIEQEKILHLRGLVMNGYMGINPIEYARESVGLGMGFEKFLSRSIGKGLHPGAVIKHPLVLNAPAHADLRKKLKEKYEGLGNSWEFMLLDENMGIEFPAVKLVDAQFLENGKFNQAQICGLFGVPLMLIQAGENPATYASATEFKRTFVDLVLAPIAVNFEEGVNCNLLTEQEQGRYYTKFNLNALLRGNITERFAAYQVGVNTEILNPNECRDLEDLNPYDGGDVYKTRTSTVKQAAGGQEK